MKKLKEILRILYYLKYYTKFKEKGTNIILSKGGFIKNPEQIVLGSNVFISRNFHISAHNLKIGNNVMIGPNVVIECHNHKFDRIGVPMFNYSSDKENGYVSIEDDVWIGANVVILPNVTIGEGVIIGAGSVVSKSLPPYTICVGIPCKPIKCRFNHSELNKHLDLVSSKWNIAEIEKIYKQYGL